MDVDVDSQISLFRRLLVENYCITATSILLFYDHIITLTDEVQRIWRRKFSGATLIYLLTRYIATFERIVLLTSLFLDTTSDKVCVPVLRVDDVLNDLIILITGLFFCLRVYAIYETDWRPAMPLLALALATTTISIYFQIHYDPIAFGPPLFGCGADFNISSSLYIHLATVSHALTLASEVLLLVMTSFKTVAIRRASSATGIKTPLTTLILRDGTIYFLVVFVIEVFAIVSQQLGSGFVLFSVWTYFDQSFTVIALCRFMLNLRGVYLSRANTPTEFGGMTSLDEQAENRHVSHVSYVVGNLGAPLEVGESSVHFRTQASDVSEDSTTAGSESEMLEMVVPKDPLGAGLVYSPGERVEMVTVSGEHNDS